MIMILKKKEEIQPKSISECTDYKLNTLEKGRATHCCYAEFSNGFEKIKSCLPFVKKNINKDFIIEFKKQLVEYTQYNVDIIIDCHEKFLRLSFWVFLIFLIA